MYNDRLLVAGGEGKTSCVPCPSNATTASEGAAEIAQCQCREGYYGTLQLPTNSSLSSWRLVCDACPAGTASSRLGE